MRAFFSKFKPPKALDAANNAEHRKTPSTSSISGISSAQPNLCNNHACPPADFLPTILNEQQSHRAITDTCLAALGDPKPAGKNTQLVSVKADNVKQDYWRLAVEKLKDEEPSLSDAITALQHAASEVGNDFAAELLLATKRSQNELVAKRWRFAVGGREVVLRDQLDKIIKAVTLFKDLGGAVGSIDPLHAGLPWAGICVLMQVRSVILSGAYFCI